jgi:hypothetical protein
MGDFVKSQLAVLDGDVRDATISGDVKSTLAWCFGQLPALYGRYCESRESRYGDEITRLVVAVLMKLADGERVCPESQKLAAGISDRFRVLHVDLGLPELKLNLPVAAHRPRPKPATRARSQTAKGKV